MCGDSIRAVRRSGREKADIILLLFSSGVSGLLIDTTNPIISGCTMLFFSRETMFFNQIVIMAKNSDKTCFYSML